MQLQNQRLELSQVVPDGGVGVESDAERRRRSCDELTKLLAVVVDVDGGVDVVLLVVRRK